MVIDTTDSYILIFVYVTLTLIQGLRDARKCKLMCQISLRVISGLSTTSCNPAPPSMTWDARHGPVWWRPTWSFGDRLRHYSRLWTLPYSPDWRSSLAGNTEEERWDKAFFWDLLTRWISYFLCLVQSVFKGENPTWVIGAGVLVLMTRSLSNMVWY